MHRFFFLKPEDRNYGSKYLLYCGGSIGEGERVENGGVFGGEVRVMAVATLAFAAEG